MSVSKRIGVVAMLAIAPMFWVSQTGYAAPMVKWSQSAVSATIAKGGTYTTTVSYTSAKDLTDVKFSWTPSVGTILEVTPATVPAITASTSNSLTLTFTLPSTTKKRNFNGSLWLAKGSRKYASPLQIRIKVEKEK